MIYLISLLPIVLYFILIKAMDGFSLGGWKAIANSFGWGLVSCMVCFFIGRYFYGGWFPAVEEIIKVTPLLVSVYRKRTAFYAETLIYGAAIGAGFSFLENILYVALSEDFMIGDAIIRGLGTSLLHMGCTALCGSIMLVICRKNKAVILLSVLSLLPSFIIHFCYNLFLLNDYIQVAILIVVFAVLFIVTYDIDAKTIHKWLDLCINNDVALFGAIKKGQLQTTNAGKYLLAVKEKFPPEIFFDICVYLELYLELNIAAKSRMIMREAGVDAPVAESVRQGNREKLTELASLRKSIGPAGVQILRPLVNPKAADQWIMNELL